MRLYKLLFESPDLLAVRPLSSHHVNVDAAIASVGTRYLPRATDGTIPVGEIRSFEDAGWFFLRPKRVDVSAAIKHLTASGMYVGRVFQNEDRHLLIETNRLTVKLSEDLTADDVQRIFDRYGLQIIRKLGFAPNLFIVEVTGDRDAFSMSSELEEHPSLIDVEPQMLERISHR